MTKCEKCDVSVMHNSSCPLCGTVLQDAKNCEKLFPSYYKLYAKMKRASITESFLMMMLTAICLVTIVNYLYWEMYKVAWSLLVTGSLVYIWFTVRKTIMLNARLGGKILFQFLLLSGFLLIIDLFTGFHKWSTTYVIPILAMVSTFGLTAIAVKKKELWFDYLGYFLVMFLMSCLPILFYPFHLSTNIWMGVAAIAYSVLTIIVMILLADKTFFDDMKKRFHF